MATENPATNVQLTAKVGGLKLLIDTGRMSVRRISKSESSILSALKSLAPVERATLAAVADTLQAKKKKPSAFAEALQAAH